jgi:hypothetical protein
MLDTTEKRLTLIMLFFFLYIISPCVFAAWMFNELSNGAFPAQSDSIAIPIAGFVVIWIIAFPFFVFFCGLIEILGRKIYGSYR